MSVFVVGDDGGLYHKWFDGTAWQPSFSDYESLGGTVVGSPEAVSWGPGRVDVFVVGTDGALYHRYHSYGSWSTNYTNVGGAPIAGQPKVVSWGFERLDVFAIGTDAQLRHKWWDRGWQPSLTEWETLPGSYSGSPAVVSWQPGRLDVFAMGAGDGRLYHRIFEKGAWRPQLDVVSKDFEIIGSPAAVTWGPFRIDLFVVAEDRSLRHRALEAGSRGFRSLGGQIYF